MANDDNNPYSLGASAIGLAFKEILFGSYKAGKEWGAAVFKLDAKAGFFSTYAGSVYDAGVPKIVSSKCNAAGLRWLGHTSSTAAYHVQSGVADKGLGLSSAGWRTCFDDCPNGGTLNGKGGMIFVR